ncbi:uncharacterized protein LOC121912543, partial [Scomber scombrus]
MELKSLEHMSKPELVYAQKGDAAIGPAIQAVQKQKWSEDTDDNPELSQLKREKDKLIMKDGLLHRLSKRPA